MSEFKTQNYTSWEEYIEQRPQIADIQAAKRLQDYEDQVFALVLRLFR